MHKLIKNKTKEQWSGSQAVEPECLDTIPAPLLIKGEFLSVFYFLGQIRTLTTLNLSGGEGNGTPLQHSCLENAMDGGAWWAAVHGVAKGRTRLSDFTFTFHFPALEKEMATHSSVLAWRIPGTGEPGGLPSRGSNRVGHDWSDSAAAAASVGDSDDRMS